MVERMVLLFATLATAVLGFMGTAIVWALAVDALASLSGLGLVLALGWCGFMAAFFVLMPIALAWLTVEP